MENCYLPLIFYKHLIVAQNFVLNPKNFYLVANGFRGNLFVALDFHEQKFKPIQGFLEKI